MRKGERIIVIGLLALSLITGLIAYKLGPDSNPGVIVKYVCWASLALATTICVGLLLLEYNLRLFSLLRLMYRHEYRQWGYPIMAIGVLIVVLLGSAETSTLWHNLGAVAVGIAVTFLGWLINHCPPLFRQKRRGTPY